MNILITSVGRRSYIVDFFKAALDHRGQVHAANSEYTYAMQIADSFVLTPAIYDHSYIDFLLDYCEKNDINALLSLFDVDLTILAQNKHRFEKRNITVIVSDSTVAKLCSDKWETNTFLQSVGIKTPTTFLSLDGAIKALNTKDITFPLIIKPRWGMGSIAIYEANTKAELKVLYNKVKNEIFKTYLKHESEADLDRCILIQEKLSGQEMGLDILNDLDGNLLSVVAKKKLSMRSGETDSAQIVDDQQLIELGMKLAKRVRHVGNLDVDIFKVEKNYYVLEMNCRFGGQYPFSHLAGADFPSALLAMIEHRPIDKKWLQAAPGLVGVKNIQPVVLLQ